MPTKVPPSPATPKNTQKSPTASSGIASVPHRSPTPRQPSPLFQIDPDADNETLLAHACESLASANVMTSDLAGLLEGTHRNTLMGIAQVIMLGELAVNRVLDNIDPQE